MLICQAERSRAKLYEARDNIATIMALEACVLFICASIYVLIVCRKVGIRTCMQVDCSINHT
jgi:hypothetical protein